MAAVLRSASDDKDDGIYHASAATPSYLGQQADGAHHVDFVRSNRSIACRWNEAHASQVKNQLRLCAIERVLKRTAVTDVAMQPVDGTVLLGGQDTRRRLAQPERSHFEAFGE